MRALALVLALSLSGAARAADDAPTATMLAPLCLDSAEQVALAKRLEADKARIQSLEESAGKVQPLPIILTAVVALALGVAAGYGVSVATQPR